jgi:hypothetical protein
VKITRNEDGTVTVRIPKVPEVYDQADGGLYIEETVTAEQLDEIIDELEGDA